MDNAELCERLQRFFAARGVDGEVADIAPIVGGFSQITYRFTVRSADGQQAYVLRMDRMSGETLTSTDRALEAKVIAALNNAGAPVPLALWADPAERDAAGAIALVVHVNGPVDDNVVRRGAEARHGGVVADLKIKGGVGGSICAGQEYSA